MRCGQLVPAAAHRFDVLGRQLDERHAAEPRQNVQPHSLLVGVVRPRAHARRRDAREPVGEPVPDGEPAVVVDRQALVLRPQGGPQPPLDISRVAVEGFALALAIDPTEIEAGLGAAVGGCEIEPSPRPRRH